MRGKLEGLLSMCRKAGRLVLGHDSVKESVQKRTAEIILFAEDFSPRTAQHIRRPAEQSGIHTLTLPLTMDGMQRLCGKRAGVAAVTDRGFAAALERLIPPPEQANTTEEERSE